MRKIWLIPLLLCIILSCRKAEPEYALEVLNPPKSDPPPPPPPVYFTSKTILASTPNTNTIYDLCVTNDKIYIVGQFQGFGSATSSCIVSYDSVFNNVNNNLINGAFVSSAQYFNGQLLIGGGWLTSGDPSALAYISGGAVIPILTVESGSTHTRMYADSNACYISGTFNMVNSTNASCAYYSPSGLHPYGTLNSQNRVTYAITKYEGKIFMAGAYISVNKFIVYNDGSNWIASGIGFNGVVRELVVYHGKLYAAGNMTADTTNSIPLGYVSSISSYSDNWSNAGNGLSDPCLSLTIHNDYLLAVTYNSASNESCIYYFDENSNSWLRAISGSLSLNEIMKIVSYKGKLYGIEYGFPGLYRFVRFD